MKIMDFYYLGPFLLQLKRQWAVGIFLHTFGLNVITQNLAFVARKNGKIKEKLHASNRK